MAVGQGVLAPVLDVPALDRIEARLEVSGIEDSARHGRLLRDVLELHRLLADVGAEVCTTAKVALLRQVSEQTAQAWLAQAQLLVVLPGALEAVDCGLLTVDQTRVLCDALAPLEDAARASVWQRVQARLIASLDGGAVLPPARFAEVVRTAVVAVDPRDAEQRRRAAEARDDVDYRRRADGLVDLFANGMTGPIAQAVLQRIRSAARPFGSEDPRTAGKRRLDALADLVLGRERLDFDLPDGRPVDPVRRHCAPTCGCRLGSPVPCGADVAVLVPLGAGLGTTDELATLTGHGPLEPDLTRALLLSAPRIRAVWVDADGVPVAADERVHVPPRDDPRALQELLLRLARSSPPELVPRHPDDHGGLSPTTAGPPATPRALTSPHPPDTPGPYRLPAALRRLVRLRAPRCEWPGCGAAAARCDIDHDVAWPYGPTCGCNCGPLCRRHHRVKQSLFTKTRGSGSAVRWTDATGRTWTSPSQHEAPSPASRPLPDVRRIDEDADLPRLDHDEPSQSDDVEPVRFELRAADVDPDEPGTDRTADRITGDDGWGLALDDPYRWAA